ARGGPVQYHVRRPSRCGADATVTSLRCGPPDAGADCSYVPPSHRHQDRPVTFPFRSIGTARTAPTPIAGFVMLAALLAGCTSQSAPTGWIPSDGTITGVITTTNAFPAPRHGSVLAASARGTSDRVPLVTAPGIAAFLSR